MARWLLSTDVLIRHIGTGGQDFVLGAKRLRDIAVSGVSFEWILADIELRQDLAPAMRLKWRSNVTRFRDQLRSSGGDVPGLSLQALERWGRLQVLELKHQFKHAADSIHMPTEERLVVASAAAGGYIYCSDHRQWNRTIERELHLAIEEL
jgi:hypothetical protein